MNLIKTECPACGASHNVAVQIDVEFVVRVRAMERENKALNLRGGGGGVTPMIALNLDFSNEASEHYKPALPTPGPWSEFCESGDWWIARTDKDGSPLEAVCYSDDISEADTNLICAAPDLLASCQGILECLEAGDTWTKQAKANVAEVLRAAIKKALPGRA